MLRARFVQAPSAWSPSPRAGRDLPLAAERRQRAPCSHEQDRCGEQRARRPPGPRSPCTAPFGPVQMRRCASILKLCIHLRARQARRTQALHLPAARGQHSAAGAGKGWTGPWRARFRGTEGRLSPPGRCHTPALFCLAALFASGLPVGRANARMHAFSRSGRRRALQLGPQAQLCRRTALRGRDAGQFYIPAGGEAKHMCDDTPLLNLSAASLCDDLTPSLGSLHNSPRKQEAGEALLLKHPAKI